MCRTVYAAQLRDFAGSDRDAEVLVGFEEWHRNFARLPRMDKPDEVIAAGMRRIVPYDLRLV